MRYWGIFLVWDTKHAWEFNFRGVRPKEAACAVAQTLRRHPNYERALRFECPSSNNNIKGP